MVIRWFASHPTAPNLLVGLLVILGVSALPELKRETFPDFTPQEVQVQIPYPGASAEDVEEAICLALEDVIDGINDVEEVRCEAREGVGSMVVQMARASGARVITTAGSEAKCQRARELGADVVIDYHRESIEDVVKREAAKGVNVFWETRREPDFDLAVELMAPRGRMVLMAGRDARPVFPVGPFYVKECSLHGFVMFKATPVEMKAAADDINHWLVQGKLRANIAATFSLDQAAEAHRLQEAATLESTAELAGKIVVTVA